MRRDNSDEGTWGSYRMNSQERVQLTLDNQETERIPLDLGATPVTSMHIQPVYKLRQALGLDPPGTPDKIIEPSQSLDEIKPDLIDALGVDVITPASLKDYEAGIPTGYWHGSHGLE